MKTTVITGGANGIGRGIALKLLQQGQNVIVISSSAGKKFKEAAAQLGVGARASYIQADLSLISENKRVVSEIKQRTDSINMLIFCATRHNFSYIETKEGLEASFSLDYLSRFLLSQGLKAWLEKTAQPVIFNVCGTGYNGEVDWDDLQHRKTFKPMHVMMQGSRLNELAAVAFTQDSANQKIKVVLYNPGAVKTAGMTQFYKNPVMRFVAGLMSKSIDEASEQMMERLAHIPNEQLSAFSQKKPVRLERSTFNKEKAARLLAVTQKLLKSHAVSVEG